MKRPFIIAHRGGAALWVENTLSAFVRAAEMGCDGAELDVQLTRDKELVVFHDFFVKRQLYGALPKEQRKVFSRPIGQIDYAALRAVDVGRMKRRRLRRSLKFESQCERMPLLRDVIAAVRDARKDFRLFVEIKTNFVNRNFSAAPEAVAEATLAELRRAHFLKNAVLVGFDRPALIHAKKIEPDIPCWFTTQKRRQADSSWAGGFSPAKFGGSYAEAIVRAGGDGWFCPSVRATAKAVREARAHGLKFGVWTVDDVRSMRALTALGVDAICTHRPDVLRAIQSRGQ